MNQMKIITPKITLINNTGTSSHSPIKYTLEIADSGAHIHLVNKDTPTMDQVIMSKEVKERLLHGRTTESSHVATLQLPGLIKQARKN